MSAPGNQAHALSLFLCVYVISHTFKPAASSAWLPPPRKPLTAGCCQTFVHACSLLPMHAGHRSCCPGGSSGHAMPVAHCTLAARGPLPSMHRKLSQTTTWASTECTDGPNDNQDSCSNGYITTCCDAAGTCKSETSQRFFIGSVGADSAAQPAPQVEVSACTGGQTEACCPPKGK